MDDIRPLAKAYKENEKNPMYAAVMDLIVLTRWHKAAARTDSIKAFMERM